jgi:hypothetical protein
MTVREARRLDAAFFTCRVHLHPMPLRRRTFLGGVAALSLPAGAARSTATADPVPARSWSRRYDTDGRSTISSVVALPHGYALLGSVGTDAAVRGWVARTDPDGAHRDSLTLGDTRTRLLDGVPSGNGVLAAGRTNVRDGPDERRRDAFAASVAGGDEATVDWAATYQPAVPDGAATATVILDDGYVLAGATDPGAAPRPWAAGIDDDGTVHWTWRGGAEGAVEDAVAVPGGLVLVGSTRSDERAWAIGLTSAGERRWAWTHGGEGRSRLEAVTPAADGGIVAVGRRGFQPDRGVSWLLSLSADGQRRWERTYPREAWNWHRDVTRLGDGYVLAGSLGNVNAGERSAWLLRVGPAGEERWERRADSGTRAHAVRPVADGGLLLAGSTESGDGDRAWLAQFGGDGGQAGLSLPSIPDVPGWTAPLGVGALAGAAGTELARQLRDGGGTDN